MTAYEILNDVKLSYLEIISQDLVGIYVHGSLAFGCFHWDSSDIDFLVVVKQKLTLQVKKQLINQLLKLDSAAPPKGLEMSVILAENCHPFSYPTPFDLHYSNAHRQRCHADLDQYCRTMNGVDKDIAAHIVMTRYAGIVLYGKAIQEVFAEVPKENYLDSIKDDIANAVNQIHENPVYYSLNLCRVLAFKEHDLILSKIQGGEWGLCHIPQSFHGLIQNAMTCYENSSLFPVDRQKEHQFAAYMCDRIDSRTT